MLCFAAMGLPAWWRFLSEQSPAEIDTGTAVTVGEKAEVAHAVEAVGKQVKEKAPDKLVGMKLHDLLAIMPMAPIVLPSEGDVVIIDSDDAAVGDGDTMGVPAEIGEHLVRPAERWLRIDDPFDAASAREMAGEHGGVVEMGKRVAEVQLTPSEGFSQSGQKEPPKQTRQHAHGQKEARPARDPP